MHVHRRVQGRLEKQIVCKTVREEEKNVRNSKRFYNLAHLNNVILVLQII